jgi:hypothetical protein
VLGRFDSGGKPLTGTKPKHGGKGGIPTFPPAPAAVSLGKKKAQTKKVAA